MVNLIGNLASNTNQTTLQKIYEILFADVFGWFGVLLAFLLTTIFNRSSASISDSILFPTAMGTIVALILFYPFLLYARNLMSKERNYYKVATKLMIYKLASGIIIFFLLAGLFISGNGPFISTGSYYLMLSIIFLFFVRKERNKKGDYNEMDESTKQQK